MKRDFKKMFCFRFKDLMTTVLIMGITSGICWGLKPISDSDFHVPLIFLLAVMLISRWTEGYLFGLVSSVIAVFGVNIVFTFPYYEMNFSLTGYPLTFICMFATSIITCTLTSRLQESEQLKIEAEREKMRANLLRAISHDFRTPLTGIIGSLNVVLENPDAVPEPLRTKMLTDAKNDAEWLINMVENLLSITRIGNDEYSHLHTEPQVPEEILTEAVTRFHKQYPDFRVDIRLPEEIILVEADAILIEQVILNLLLNAALHGEYADRVRISLSVRDGEALFALEDNGKGIPKEAVNHLFEEGFSQIRSGKEDARRGMGIGLNVCRTIIRVHGGIMWAEKREKGGACICFTLPLSHLAVETLDSEV